VGTDIAGISVRLYVEANGVRIEDRESLRNRRRRAAWAPHALARSRERKMQHSRVGYCKRGKKQEHQERHRDWPRRSHITPILVEEGLLGLAQHIPESDASQRK